MSDVYEFKSRGTKPPLPPGSEIDATEASHGLMVTLLSLREVLERYRENLKNASQMPGGEKVKSAIGYIESAILSLEEAKFPVYREAIRLMWEKVKDV